MVFPVKLELINTVNWEVKQLFSIPMPWPTIRAWSLQTLDWILNSNSRWSWLSTTEQLLSKFHSVNSPPETVHSYVMFCPGQTQSAVASNSFLAARPTCRKSSCSSMRYHNLGFSLAEKASFSLRITLKRYKILGSGTDLVTCVIDPCTMDYMPILYSDLGTVSLCAIRTHNRTMYVYTLLNWCILLWTTGGVLLKWVCVNPSVVTI